MSRQSPKRLAAAVLLGVGLTAPGGTAVANSSAWSFTMTMRHVSGLRNHHFHQLEAGNLTLHGHVWIYEKMRASEPAPFSLTFEVMKGDNDDKATILCTATVTPSSKLNEKTAISKSCGRIAADKYWLRVYKGGHSKDPDGWHSQGTGTLDITN